MLKPFNTMSETARIWVYQSNRRLSSGEIDHISHSAGEFIDTWEAHGAAVYGSFQLLHDQFLIIAADESFNPVTGCSTDESVHFVRDLENELGINFFDRSQVAFLVENTVRMMNLNELRKKEFPFPVDEETIMFNNLINKKRQLETEWQLPSGKTWIARFIS